LFALLRIPSLKENDMGYRYKHGGYHNRMYRAVVMLDGRPRTVTYSSPWGLNMGFNFRELQDKVQRMFGVKIPLEAVVERRLLADWEV
jgi:hypothetical protein